MPYFYRCNACAADAPRRGSRADAVTDQTEHRERAHHGLAPDDDIEHEPGLLALGVGRAFDAATRPRPHETSPGPTDHPAVRQGLMLLGAGIALALLLNALFR